jgi:hypothetical protein
MWAGCLFITQVWFTLTSRDDHVIIVNVTIPYIHRNPYHTCFRLPQIYKFTIIRLSVMDYSKITDPLSLILQDYGDSEEEEVESKGRQVEIKSNSTSS